MCGPLFREGDTSIRPGGTAGLAMTGLGKESGDHMERGFLA
nr:MAG TPA: hypothetical protein [Caudoviricetes sp.]